MSWFEDVERALPDQIYGVQEEYVRDKRCNKVNLSIGVYRDENGLSFIPESVANAEKIIIDSKPHKEYAPIEGFADFRLSVAKFVFGVESDIIVNERHATVQSLGGTGALRVGAMFLCRFVGHRSNRTIYLPQQTWNAHNNIFRHSGFDVKHYRYWNQHSFDLDINALTDDISGIPDNSIILFHAIAHNPTGTDPTPHQWQQIFSIVKQKNLFVFFDLAYLGFASGDVSRDRYVIDMFAKENRDFAIAITFSKNMGVYGERIGALSIVCSTNQQAVNVMTQLKRIIRPIYSHPPNHGSRIVNEVLNNCGLYESWLKDVNAMYNRIKSVRFKLYEALTQLNCKQTQFNLYCLTTQVGMFWYSGLNQSQVNQLKEEFAVYIADDGRVNMTAINDTNIPQIANSIHSVISSNKNLPDK